MQTISTVLELRAAIQAWRSQGKTIAFVPTMGNLHAGHLKLVEVAKTKADHIVVSIFVNPTQFGPNEDFQQYPRTEAEDLEKLAAVNTDLVFLPSVTEMYATDSRTVVTVDGLAHIHCGASRPGHFDGVATVVCKLFNMVQPDTAVFGLKDFQQFRIIETMVRDLNIPVQLVGVETVREENGLALSSRNNFLKVEERTVAAKLYQNLCRAQNALLANQRSFSEIQAEALLFLSKAGLQPEYFCICRNSDLKKAEPDDQDLVILAAVKLGKTRLIDNIQFSRKLTS